MLLKFFSLMRSLHAVALYFYKFEEMFIFVKKILSVYLNELLIADDGCCLCGCLMSNAKIRLFSDF